MNTDNYDALIAAYEADVGFPDVSGMEHLDMLMNRSEIEHSRGSLTEGQKVRLDIADNKLLQNADQFHNAIGSVANLAEWRNRCKIPATEWWWYLDVIVQLPMTRD